MIRGIYIDDDEQQREMYSELLSDGDLDFSTKIQPVSLSHLVDRIKDIQPDVIVMDYRLDGSRTVDWQNDFKAGGLAQVLREEFVDSPDRDIPIILLSTEHNIQHLFTPDRTSHDLFDLWYLKEELHLGAHSRRNEILCKIRTLVDGYHQIRVRSQDTIAKSLPKALLGVGDNEYSEMNTDGLKLTMIDSEGIVERPHVVMRQFYHNIINRSGLLLSPYGLAAKLGIEPLDLPTLLNASEIKSFSYGGVLSSGWDRYWKHRFVLWEVSNFDPLLTSLTGEFRASALSERFGLNIRPAVSKWTHKSDEYFSFACCVCLCPTEIRHSLAVFEPKLLPFQDRNRVCYDCVERETGMRSKRIQISEADEEVVDAIRSQKLLRPSETNK